LRVLLADDHSIVRRGLRGLLEPAGLTVVAEASDGLEAVRLCEEYRPDILILDIGMPKLSGIEVAARAQKVDPPPGVIILSVHGDEAYIMRALAAGARAYLLKSATDEDLIPAVRAVAAGKPFLSPAVTAVLVEDYVRRLQQRGLTDSYHLLTDREKEVLQLLAEGRSNKEVATLLDLALSNRGDTPGEPDAEAEPPQHGGDRALRGPEGSYRLTGGLSSRGPLTRSRRSLASLRRRRLRQFRRKSRESKNSRPGDFVPGPCYAVDRGPAPSARFVRSEVEATHMIPLRSGGSPDSYDVGMFE
jgi:two-component system response regulator NreC